MKLLFDQNISYRIIKAIADIFPESKQVRNLNLENSTDNQIWDYAKINDYCIVTFDSDFYDLSIVRGRCRVRGISKLCLQEGQGLICNFPGVTL